MGVHNSPFRLQYSTLSLHQTDSSDPAMGTQPGYTNQRISRRFDLHSNQLSPGSSAYSNGSQQTSVTRLDNQFRQISIHTNSTIGTSGFQFGHNNNGSSSTNSKDPGFKEIITTGSTTANADAETDPQLDNEDTSSNICTSTSTSVHTTSSPTQESNGPTIQRLGPATTPTTRMLEGNWNMDASTTAVEREIFPTSNTKGNTICGREQYGLGLSLATPNHTRLLEPARGLTVDQLEGVESSIPCNSVVQYSKHQSPHSDRQHHFIELYQQAGGDMFTIVDDSSNRSVEALSEAPDSLNSPTYTWCGEQHSGQGIVPIILQEPVENPPNNVSKPSTALRIPRRRSVCRSNNTPASKVRLLETRSGRAYPRRIQSQLVSVPQSLDQPSLEHDHQVFTEITTRTGSTGNNCDTSLTVSTVLSSSRNTSDTSTNFPDSSKPPDSQEFLSTTLTCDSPTNHTYKAAQLAFVEWAPQNNIAINTFSADDLVNFLVHIRNSRSYQLNTLKLWRSAISRFHREPSTLANCPSLNGFFSIVASTTAPRHIHRPTIDFSPTLVHLSKILSDTSTSLSLLQPKLAFLLGMVALLRPSDLARISLLSAKVDPQLGIFQFDIVAPKERRNQVRIIKPYNIHPHPDTRLCPVQCFQAVRTHPHVSSRPPDVLFVNSANPALPAKSTTISTWLRRLLHHSTSESRVSVRSLGSSLALRRGIPVDDIVTLGNWRSSETFHNFYRREHLSTVNFTTSTLDMTAPPVQVDDLDDLAPLSPGASEFVDAPDTFPDVPSLNQQL
ncbi:hypothetical protein G6F56_006289 [Rhizopus delemar]|nr:hypothetical protein G6F56_006289 [Rhizopus delemar]